MCVEVKESDMFEMHRVPDIQEKLYKRKLAELAPKKKGEKKKKEEGKRKENKKMMECGKWDRGMERGRRVAGGARWW